MKFGQGKEKVSWNTQLRIGQRLRWPVNRRANIACSGGISYNYLARRSSGALAKEMMAQWLRGLTALPEELGSIPHNSLYF